ncbi:MAG TPA: dihydropteroate synthase [Planctomycetes bacterium]|nr:dihydropteroate synthase [Planctomycetota bacterium]
MEGDRRPRIVGILNVTPDSFSDGGRCEGADAQVAAAERLVGGGADCIEIGGESTRPGAPPVSCDEELGRVLPAMEALAGRVGAPLAVDTSKAAVAREALARGAVMINDVTALRGDPRMAETLAGADCRVVLMHMRGTPRDMQRDVRYDDVVGEVLAFLGERVRAAEDAGIGRGRLIVDPGLGFGKRVSDNLRILRDLRRFEALGLPVMVGASRKSFIGAVTGRPVEAREIGTCAAHVWALLGGAAYLRVHDAAAARECARMVRAIAEAAAEFDAVSTHGHVD